MHCTVKMTEDLYWVGASDRRLALFESVYPIPRGVSYNAYVLLDEKTVLLDTVDQSVAGQFFENLTHVLGGRPLDYIVVHHMEPDHAKTLEETRAPLSRCKDHLQREDPRHDPQLLHPLTSTVAPSS